jgi:hypothetical protein
MKKVLQLLKRTFYRPKGLDINSTYPVSKYFGLDRGTPIDRYYIEDFLQKKNSHIKGRVLEIAESTYSKKFGNNVSSFEVLYPTDDNPKATIIGDLTNHQSLPINSIDCFICTQTFHCIKDFDIAIKGSFQVLKPEGILLATLPSITQISRYDMDRWGDFWRFTPLSAKTIFEETFGQGNVEINSYGNCYSAIAFLRGLAIEEIRRSQLDTKDEDYPLVITVVAKKRVTQNK